MDKQTDAEAFLRSTVSPLLQDAANALETGTPAPHIAVRIRRLLAQRMAAPDAAKLERHLEFCTDAEMDARDAYVQEVRARVGKDDDLDDALRRAFSDGVIWLQRRILNAPAGEGPT